MGLQQDASDEVAGDDEEDVDAQVPAGAAKLVVKTHHRQDGNGPKTVDIRPVRGVARVCGWLVDVVPFAQRASNSSTRAGMDPPARGRNLKVFALAQGSRA